jgi:hypothetical protein
MNAHTLEDLLSGTQSPLSSIRSEAEVNLATLFTSQQEGIELVVSFASAREDGDTKTPLRHLAILLLGHDVEKHWCTDYTSSTKSLLLTFIFQWKNVFYQNASQLSLHRAAIVLLAKIVGVASMAEVEEICITLQNELQTPISIPGSYNDTDELSVKGRVTCFCVSCLYEIALEADYYRLVMLLKYVYPFIQQVFSDNDQLSHTSSDDKALVFVLLSKFMKLCLRKLGEARIASGFDEEESTMIYEIVAHWDSLSFEWLKQHCTRVEDVMANQHICIELLASLTSILDCFSRESNLDLCEAFQYSYFLLNLMVESYQTQMSSGDIYGNIRSGATTYYGSDGDRDDLMTLVIQSFEFLNALICLQDAPANGLSIENLVGSDYMHPVDLFIAYMQLIEEKRDEWHECPNEYIAGEYDDSGDYSLRSICCEILYEVCNASKEFIYSYLLTTTQSLLETLSSLPSFDANDGNITADNLWHQHLNEIVRFESLLWVLGTAFKRYVKIYKQYQESVACDNDGNIINQKKYEILQKLPPEIIQECLSAIVTFTCETIALKPTTTSFHSILCGRVFWLIGEFVPILNGGDPHSFFNYISKCTDLLGLEFPLTLRLECFRTLGRILVRSKNYKAVFEGVLIETCNNDHEQVKNMLSAYVNKVTIHAIETIRDCNEATIHIPLGIIQIVMKHHPEVITSDIGNYVVSIGIQILEQFFLDALVVDVVNDVFMQLVRTAPVIAQHSFHVSFFAFIENHLEHIGASSSYSCNSYVGVIIEIIKEVALCRKDDSDETSLLCRLQVSKLLLKVIGDVSFVRIKSECIHTLNSILSREEGSSMEEMALFTNTGTSPDEFVQALLQQIHSVLQEVSLSISLEGSDNNGHCVAPCIGLLVHLITKVKNSSVYQEAFVVILQHAVRCMHGCDDEYTRYSIMMALVHALARDTERTLLLLLCNVYGSQEEANTTPNIDLLGTPQDLFDLWFSLHKRSTSRYNCTVSTISLMEVIPFLLRDESTQSLAFHCFQTILQKWNDLKSYSVEDETFLEGSLYGDGTGEESVIYSEDDDDYNYTSEDDDFEADKEESGDVEFCLSDMLSAATSRLNGGNDDGDVYASSPIHVSDNLMYNPAHQTDPLLTNNIALLSNDGHTFAEHMMARSRNFVHFLMSIDGFDFNTLWVQNLTEFEKSTFNHIMTDQ